MPIASMCRPAAVADGGLHADNQQRVEDQKNNYS
jgi:hypothetical protein